MYILFEKNSSDAENYIYNFDCMGYAENEADAMDWRDKNPEYRTIKYCPDTRK